MIRFAQFALPLPNLVPNQICRLVVVGSLIGLVGVGGCKPPAKAQAPVVSQEADASVATLDAPQVADAAAPLPQARAQTKPKTAIVGTPSPKNESKADSGAGGKAYSIAGGWVNAGGACDSDASVFFNSDGTYLSEGEKGTWALSGKTLTVTTATTFDDATPTPTQGPDESTGEPTGTSANDNGGTGEKAVLTLLSITDDAARVVLSNGSNANWTRCTS